MPGRSFSRAIWSRMAALLALAPLARAEIAIVVHGDTRDLAADAPLILQVLESDPPPKGCWRRWRELWHSRWRWQVLDGDRVLPGGSGGVIEDLGADRFRYTPPRTLHPRTLKLQVTRRHSPEAGAAVTVKVVPPAPLAALGPLGPHLTDLIRAYAPEAARAPLSTPLPFLDLAGGRRSRPGQRVLANPYGPADPGVVHDWPNRSFPFTILAGYGLPVRLRWRPVVGAGQLLSWRVGYQGEGADTLRMDVTAQTVQDVVFTGPVVSCMLETLTPADGTDDTWFSVIQEGHVQVRGLLPMAGAPEADPAAPIRDGRGVSARLGEPWGLALVAAAPCACGLDDPMVVVAEPRAHVLRALACDTSVTTRWGSAGVPGHRDGPAAEALFNHPTHVACLEQRCPTPTFATCPTGRFVVADSGNHLIRLVGEDGAVTTLAGSPEAGPGHLDHPDPRQARFNQPQGVAVGLDGSVYVADQGNQVIRKISLAHGVTTLAGLPGRPGAEDGLGAAARFLNLKGLALEHRTGQLYVADGHAVRRIGPDGGVTTVLGWVTQAGFRDDLEQGPGRWRTPCLKDPCGLAVGSGALFIADTGNHAVREFSLDDGTLRTVAGDPGRPAIAWGLLRDGLERFPATGYGSLLAPRGIAGHRGAGAEALVLATGSCLVQIPAVRPPRARPQVRLEPPGPLLAGEAFTVAFEVPDQRLDQGATAPFDFHFAVEFQDADGTEVGPPVTGRGAFAVPQRVPGRPFTRAGLGGIRVRCVTLDGLSADAAAAVPVR